MTGVQTCALPISAGSTGPTGPTGPQGSAGSTGPTGPTGPSSWSAIPSGTRTDYNLGFQPPNSDYAGFYFSKSTSAASAADAGYFLIRGGSDSFTPYTQEGITLVADANSLNLFARGSSLISGGNAWVRMGTGSSETFRLQSDYSYSLNSSRAPIFYDSDDTSRYVDGNSTSVLNALQITGYNSSASAIMFNWPTAGYIGLYGSVVNSAKLANFRATSGDSYRVSLAALGGLALVNGDATSDQGAGGVIFAPGGGRYSTTTSSVTGAIKIAISEPSADVMFTMTVRVYTYDGQSFEITCGGYPYGSAGQYWANVFAYMNTSVRANLTVRFGGDGTNACVWIGETGSTWNYPQVQVVDFTAG